MCQHTRQTQNSSTKSNHKSSTKEPSICCSFQGLVGGGSTALTSNIKKQAKGVERKTLSSTHLQRMQKLVVAVLLSPWRSNGCRIVECKVKGRLGCYLKTTKTHSLLEKKRYNVECGAKTAKKCQSLLE